MVLAPGDEFAGYTIEAVLGTGGMGAVYLAKHPRLPRRDALKLLSPTLSDDPNFRTRFEREADLAAGLVHRNIVAVYDRGAGGPDGKQLWISMQYVAGTDAAVAARAGEGAMTPERVVNIISEVGAGLDHAHRAGLLHRDVKPANILLAASDDPSEPEHVLLTDFGIAKSTDEVQHLTGTGNLLATLAYASPEQIEARPLDHRVDIYALGCVLYELLTGSVPFPEATPFATMTAHLKQPPPRPSARVGWLPPGFDAVVAKAMAKNPDDRYSSCREMALACRAALTAVGPAADPTRAEVSPGGPATTQRFGVGAAALPGGVAPAEAVGLTRPRPPFVVTVRRTFRQGGRVQELGPVRSNVMPITDQAELEQLLEKSNFFALPPRLPLEYVVADDVLQEITVENAQLRRTVTFEREGSKHTAELDALIRLMGRHAGWQELRPLATGAAYPGWSPTGTVPPLGGQSFQPTESVGAPGAAQAGAHPSGPVSTAVGGGWSGTGPHPSGPFAVGGSHPSGPQALMGTGPHTGPARTRSGGPAGPSGGPSAGSSRRWLWLAVAAVVLVAAIGTTVFFVTRPSGPTAPASPTGLAGTGSEDLTVSLTWSPSSGATGYTLSRDGTQVYQGAATSFTDDGGQATGGTGVHVGRHTYTLTASNVDGQRSPASTVAVDVPKGPWGNDAFMIAKFPELLPASPADKGYGDSTCSVVSDTYESGADSIIGCTDPDGVYFEVSHFPDTQTWKDYLDRAYINTDNPPVETPWQREDGADAGVAYRSPDADTLPYVFTTFSDPALENYFVYSSWKDHTYQELYDNWWANAPF